MKLGIVGSGTIVQEFLARLMNLEGLTVMGIQGVKEMMNEVTSLCNEHGIPCATSDFDELCALDIDTVYVAVPNYLHFDYCKRALEKGLHVIVEKPMTSNLTETLYLKEKAKEKQLFLFEAITTLYLGNYKKIQEWLPRIGDVKMVQSQYSKCSKRYDAFRNGEILPVFDPKKSGGALMDLNLYNIHYVMGLFGKPLSASYLANVERNIDTNGVLIMNYPSFRAICIAAKDCKGLIGSIIQGTNGSIRSMSSPNMVGEIQLELNDGTKESYDDKGGFNRLLPEFTEFIRAINEKDLTFCYDMLDKSIAVSALQTSARQEAGIKFPADETIL